MMPPSNLVLSLGTISGTHSVSWAQLDIRGARPCEPSPASLELPFLWQVPNFTKRKKKNVTPLPAKMNSIGNKENVNFQK